MDCISMFDKLLIQIFWAILDYLASFSSDSKELERQCPSRRWTRDNVWWSILVAKIHLFIICFHENIQLFTRVNL